MIKASLHEMLPVYHMLFNSILNLGTMPQTWCGGLITRIYKYDIYILHNSQIGFLPKNRRADHVLTLRTLVDKYVHYHNENI